MAATIKSLRVQGMRCLRDVTLPLNGLSVLIGDNGAGKSTLIEAFELVRRLGKGDNVNDLTTDHRGHSLFGTRGGELAFAVQVQVDGEAHTWTIHLRGDVGLQIASERLLGPDGDAVLERGSDGGHAWLFVDDKRTKPKGLSGQQSVLSQTRHLGNRVLEELADAIAGIQVHLPFVTLPAWAARQRRTEPVTREAAMVLRAERLEPGARNLISAWHTINNGSASTRKDAVELARLGLGQRLLAVNTPADRSGGSVGLVLEFAGQEPLPAMVLSAGQLAWLSFVAMHSLQGDMSLLAFDEPETHLHPSLMARVLDLLVDLAQDRPVVLATHSEALLDGLGDDAAHAAVLVELDEKHATRLMYPDKGQLDAWLADYAGLGSARAAGAEAFVMTRTKPGSRQA